MYFLFSKLISLQKIFFRKPIQSNNNFLIPSYLIYVNIITIFDYRIKGKRFEFHVYLYRCKEIVDNISNKIKKIKMHKTKEHISIFNILYKSYYR